MEGPINGNEVSKEHVDSFVEIDKVVDSVPPELVIEGLAQALINFTCSHGLVQRIHQTLMHFAGTSLIDRETELHQEALQGL